MAVTLVDDLATFSLWQLRSGDIDPVYPMLTAVGEILDLDTEQLAQLALLYVAYYHLPSALDMFCRADFTWPRPEDVATIRRPTGTERRGHRSPGRLAAHVASVEAHIEAHGGLVPWMDFLAGAGCKEWPLLMRALQDIDGNGRWASYKTGEILVTVLGFPSAPTDAGHAHSSGPRQGLGLFFADARGRGNSIEDIRTLDRYTRHLAKALAEAGAPMPVEQVETVLCDFHSMSRGRYYVGRDTDELLEQITGAPWLWARARDALMEGRQRAFQRRWLGEEMGWSGIRKPLLRLYRQTGRIEWWTQTSS